MKSAEIAAAFGQSWFPYQKEVLDAERATNDVDLRVCLYYRTGAGKTTTALALLAQAGVTKATVVTPPRTFPDWESAAKKVGIQLTCLSHSLYRQPGRKFSRLEPFIIDEFHMLGGPGAQGWKKLHRQARRMQAPLILLSATPNYNDAERVFCVESVLNAVLKADFINWIYRNCETEENPFGRMPKVLGFRDKRAAKEHLAELEHVYYVPDPHENFPIIDQFVNAPPSDRLITYGHDVHSNRIAASLAEMRSLERKNRLLWRHDGIAELRAPYSFALQDILSESPTPIIIFCARATIASAAYRSMQLSLEDAERVGLVTGKTKNNDQTLAAFKSGELDVLVGTATMATGVDGLDKVCDTMVLLDDTEDDAQRRQLIGRILPRGSDTDTSNKKVYRLRSVN